MSLEIKTSTLKPRRQSFAYIARRYGEDRPASRYDEATLDMQLTANFHYRPTWDPEYEIYDERRTAIKMADWYALRDPRQYYYGTYTIARSKMMEAQEKNFLFVQKRDLLQGIDAAWTQKIKDYLLPLRHYEWGANMNNCQITDQGYGAAVTQATMFAAMDRLGIAQIISRTGLAFDGNSGESLAAAKEAWLHRPMWQGVRHMMEDSFVVADWFELFVAQNAVMDGLIYPLVYEHFDKAGQAHGAAPLSILSEFTADWYAETAKWADAMLKIAAAESQENAALLGQWFSTWSARALEAFRPIAEHVLGDGAQDALDAVRGNLTTRVQKAGLPV